MARSGNGVDITAVYRLLTEISGRLDNHEHKLNELIVTVNEHSRRFDQVAGMLSDHGRKLDNLSHDIVGLQDRIGDYHHSVVGHGIALNGIEERVKRLEDHLGLETGG